MAPKATKAAAPKKAAGASSHGSYIDMIKDAILVLKERNGSSRQAIKKYILANNNLGGTTDAAYNSHLSRALASGEEQGVFSRPKGPSGPVKLAKKSDKAAAPKKAATTKKATGTKVKTESKTKKPAAAKKASTTTTKKAPAKKAATATKAKTAAKPKANTAKKATKKAAPTAAPAVTDKAPVVLGKTKSGRVTKSKAPSAGASKKKAAAPKKAAPKKAAAAAPKKA